MKEVLIRLEQGNSRKATVTSVTPSQALIVPLMGLTIEKPTHLLLPAEGEAKSGTQAKEGSTNGITPIPKITIPKTNPMQPPRGGEGRGGRSRGGRGGGRGGGGGVETVDSPSKGVTIMK
jgi:hypothetical protein